MHSTTECDRCSGSGWIVQGSAAAQCACLRERIVSARFEAASVPAKLASATLDIFEPQVHPTAADALSACRNLVDEWPRSIGLFLRGNPGCGKTHLAVATLRAVMLEHGARGLFIATPELFSRLQATFRDGAEESESQVMAQLVGADLLVLDELGARRVTDWSHDVVTELVSRRYDEQRPTVLTSNYDRRELVERVGTRLVSRLVEMCVSVRIDAPDYRMRMRRELAAGRQG